MIRELRELREKAKEEARTPTTFSGIVNAIDEVVLTALELQKLVTRLGAAYVVAVAKRGRPASLVQ